MTPLQLDVRSLVLLGAHADDIAIAAGGTLLTLADLGPIEVRALVLTGGGTPREAEERAALAAFLPGCQLDVTILDLPDGHLPDHRGAVKTALRALAASPADLVLGPHPGDQHQDHRTLAELIPTEFRDHLALGYEIPKWEHDLVQPTVHRPLSEHTMTRKVDLLHEHYPSQVHRDWFDAETFTSLARVRGVQCRRRYAEAFVVPRATLAFGGEL